MRCNAAGIEFIKRHEGLRLKAYPDPGSKNGRPWTIGYGHTGVSASHPEGDVEPGAIITAHQAEAILDVDLDIAERAVLRKTEGITLNENEFSALVSFVFNCGEAALGRSLLLKKLLRSDRAGAAKCFMSWVYNDGKVMDVLVRRRAEEQKLFLTPPSTTVAA